MRSEKKNNSIKRLALWAIVSVTLAVATALIVLCGFSRNFSENREIIDIPDLVGLKIENIEGFDRINIESEPMFSSTAPRGTVISQEPYGGARRKVADGEKYTVKLTVSLGKETKTLPDLKNYKYTSAAAALRSLGAKVKIVSIYDDRAERDTVIRTIPEPGEKIELGDTVTLFVSRSHTHKDVIVKNFTGMALERAATEILSQGLSLGEIKREYCQGMPRGYVISQSVLQGEAVPFGSRIDICVSDEKGEEDLHPFRGNY